MDVNDTERKLQDAINARNENAFDAAIAECKDFKQIFKFTHQCATATLARKISVREKRALINMMEGGLKRMHALNSDDWASVLGEDANKAEDCLDVIEHYADPQKSQAILYEGRQNHRLRYVGFLLWNCCKSEMILYRFSRLRKYISGEYSHFLYLLLEDAYRTNRFGKYFSFLVTCSEITNKPLHSNYILSRYGAAMERLFIDWRSSGSEKRKKLLHAMESSGLSFQEVCKQRYTIEYLIFQAYQVEEHAVPLLRILSPMYDDINMCPEMSLHLAAENGQVERVQALLAQGADPNEVRDDGNTPLLAVLEYLNDSLSLREQENDPVEKIIRLLLESGANVNYTRHDGITPLFVVAGKYRLNLLWLLLEYGANVNAARHSDGETPLLAALRRSDDKMVNALLEYGADVNQARKDGVTPVFLACEKDNHRIPSFLKRGARLHTCAYLPSGDLQRMALESNTPLAGGRMLLFLQGKTDPIAIRPGEFYRILMDMDSEWLNQKTQEQKAQRKHGSVTMMGILTRRAGLFRNYVPRDLVPMIGQMIFPRHVRKTGGKV